MSSGSWASNTPYFGRYDTTKPGKEEPKPSRGPYMTP